MSKLIEFYPAGYKGKERIEHTFAQTSKAIEEGRDMIRTESMLHLSFTLIDQGYSIILVTLNGDKYSIYPGVRTPNGKTIDRGHNIAKLLINGAFDRWIYKNH